MLTEYCKLRKLHIEAVSHIANMACLQLQLNFFELCIPLDTVSHFAVPCSKTRSLYLEGAEDSVIAIPSDSLPFNNIHHGVFGSKPPSSDNSNCADSQGKYKVT
jgi:hypothetical protein